MQRIVRLSVQAGGTEFEGFWDARAPLASIVEEISTKAGNRSWMVRHGERRLERLDKRIADYAAELEWGDHVALELIPA